MSQFATLLTEKLKSGGTTLAAAAQEIGVSLPALRGASTGRSVPNARSADKFAKFLGVSSEEFATLIGDGKAAKGRRGRPSSKSRGRASGAAKSASGRKPGRKTGGGSAADALAAITAALEESSALAGDALAVKVHGLDKKARATIEVIVDSLT